MRVFLTGATGYVGRHVARNLVRAGHTVSALVRRGSEGKLPEEVRPHTAIVEGRLERPDTYRKALQVCDAVVNLPGLLRESPTKGITFEKVHFLGTKLLVDEARGNHMVRFLQMSALGVRSGASAKYQETKFRAEEYLKESGVRWTIFRPSIMFGNEKEGLPNFISVLRDLLTMAPFVVPVPGNGKYLFQPVAVQNVSEGFVKALENDSSVGKVYDVAGPDRYTYDGLLDMVSYVTGRNKLKIHQPMWLVKTLATLFGRFAFFPVTRDQLRMLEEGNISDRWTEFFEDFAITPLRIVEHLHRGL